MPTIALRNQLAINDEVVHFMEQELDLEAIRLIQQGGVPPCQRYDQYPSS
ncbi:hypothetical protein [Nitrospira sp. Nam74]